MNEGASYAENFKLGEPLTGSAICSVQESKNPSFKVGDLVMTYSGWQTHTILSGKILDVGMPWSDTVKKIPDGVKPSYFLGSLGMPGFTAHHGLMDIGQPKSGETVVVSAATGPVGSMVGQIAKSKGCYVVGIAGGSKKCDLAVNELGFDACVDHKSSSFKEDLKQACSKGIDVYFENVGGPVLMAVIPLLNVFARVPLCGAIAWYNNVGLPEGPDFSPLIVLAGIGKRIKYQGFIVSDHNNQYDSFLKETIPLIQSGKIKVKEDVVKGIKNAPEAFIGLLQGKNFGKLVIEI
jgi:NADPH-dependent curcumin reductase CurA